MPNEKVSQLPTVANATLADVIYAIQGGVSVQETLQQVFNIMLSNNVLSNAGNPNGNVAGNTYQFCWDTVGNALYICTTSGSAITAVWTRISLPNGNNGVLVTNNSGVASISRTLPSGLTIAAPVINQIVGTNGFNVAAFADVGSSTDYFNLTSGTNNNALIQLTSSQSTGSFGLYAKGAGVQIGSAPGTGATTVPISMYNGTNAISFTVPSLTGTRSVTFPDGNVILVAGTMAPTLNAQLTTPTILGSHGLNVMTFADVASSTDFLKATSGVLNGATFSLQSSSTDASFSILAKGGGGINIGSTGSTTTPIALQVGANQFNFSVPSLTSQRILTFPDANVTLVAGTMAAISSGSWTPIDSSGAGLSLTAAGAYVKIGNMVFAWCNITYPATASGANAIIGGLPFSGGDNTHNGATLVYTTSSTANKMLMNGGGSAGTTANIYTAAGVAVTNAGMTGTINYMQFVYA